MSTPPSGMASAAPPACVAREAARKRAKPSVTTDAAIALARTHFGVAAVPSSVKIFDSYDDKNFFLRSASDGREYVLKVHNGADSGCDGEDFLDAQNAVLVHLDEAGFACPVPCPVAAVATTKVDESGEGTRRLAMGPLHPVMSSLLVFQSALIASQLCTPWDCIGCNRCCPTRAQTPVCLWMLAVPPIGVRHDRLISMRMQFF